MDSLDLKYAKSVILRLTEKDTFMKSDLFDIVTSNQVLDKLLDALQADGYIRKDLSKYGRRTYSISLTPKGRVVAQQLKKTEEVSEGKSELVLHESDYDDFISHTKEMSVITHLNDLDAHVAIHEVNYDHQGHDRVVFVYVKLNGNGILRLWCEADSSFQCWHVKYAWTIPDVQAMIQYHMGKGNVKKVD